MRTTADLAHTHTHTHIHTYIHGRSHIWSLTRQSPPYRRPRLSEHIIYVCIYVCMHKCEQQWTLHTHTHTHIHTYIQVHDELIFEVSHDKVPQTADLVCLSMKHAAAAISVPISVKVKIGHTWGSMSTLSDFTPLAWYMHVCVFRWRHSVVHVMSFTVKVEGQNWPYMGQHEHTVWFHSTCIVCVCKCVYMYVCTGGYVDICMRGLNEMCVDLNM